MFDALRGRFFSQTSRLYSINRWLTHANTSSVTETDSVSLCSSCSWARVPFIIWGMTLTNRGGRFAPFREDLVGQATPGSSGVFADQCFEAVDIGCRGDWLDIHHVEVAERVKELVCIQNVGDTTAHACSKIPSGFSKDNDCSSSHVLTSMVADAFNNGYCSAVSDSKAFSDHPTNEDTPGRGAIEQGVSGDDVFLRTNVACRWDDSDAAGRPLPR